MPAARQRRLNDLIDKSKGVGLSRSETKEMEAMLEEVDRKSFWMLASEMLRGRRVKSPSSSTKTASVAR